MICDIPVRWLIIFSPFAFLICNVWTLDLPMSSSSSGTYSFHNNAMGYGECVCNLLIWEYFNLGPTIMPPHHLLLENLSIELCCPLFIVLSNWVDGWFINLVLWIPNAEFAWNVTMLLQYHCNGVCCRWDCRSI